MLPWPTLFFIFLGCDTMFHPSPNITGYPGTQDLLPRHQQRAGDGSDLPAHGRLQHVAGQDIAAHLRWIAMTPWAVEFWAPSWWCLWPLKHNERMINQHQSLDFYFFLFPMLRHVETCRTDPAILQNYVRVKSDNLTQTMLLSQIFHQTMCWNQFLKTSHLLSYLDAHSSLYVHRLWSFHLLLAKPNIVLHRLGGSKP